MGLPFWLIAVIIVGVVLGLVFFGRGVSGVIRQNPTLGMGIVVLLAFTAYGVPVALRLTGTIGKGKVKKEEVIGIIAGYVFLLLLVKFVGDAQLGKRARNPRNPNRS